jgi:hypothetical protein
VQKGTLVQMSAAMPHQCTAAWHRPQIFKDNLTPQSHSCNRNNNVHQKQAVDPAFRAWQTAVWLGGLKTSIISSLACSFTWAATAVQAPH